MNKTLIALIALSALSSNALATDDAEAKYREESRKTAQEFMQKLGGTLKEQLQAGGPEKAVAVCKEVAPALAAAYSSDGRSVKRVSLKPRNRALGTPDAWEERWLQHFEQDLRQGKPIAEMEASAITEGPDGRWYRYVKAIPTQQMCLQCHGQDDQIPPGVKALLGKEYPDDQATGYSAGMVRGAISIRRKLD